MGRYSAARPQYLFQPEYPHPGLHIHILFRKANPCMTPSPSPQGYRILQSNEFIHQIILEAYQVVSSMAFSCIVCRQTIHNLINCRASKK